MAKFKTYDDVRAYVASLPISQLIDGYAELLWESQNSKVDPIKISEEQFRTMFKIVGFTLDGKAERRGRPRKED